LFAAANPYIFISRRQSDTFSDAQLREFTSDPVFHPTFGFNIPRPALKNITVETKTFFIRLIFYDTINPVRDTEYGGIQMIVSVSSTMVMAQDRRILSGVDFQFGIIFIGPVRVQYRTTTMGDAVPDLFADATVLATMVDYLSLGCTATTKKAEYTITSRSKQFIAPIEDHFKLIITEDFQYVLTFISPTSSKHDLIMRLFRGAFDGDFAAITSKWGWDPVTLAALTGFRQKMAEVVRILVSPMLEQSYAVHTEEDTSEQSPEVQQVLAKALAEKNRKEQLLYRENRTLKAKRTLPRDETLPRDSMHDGGRKTVKRVKSRPNKSKPKPKTKSKPKPKSKSNLKCKRRMNMNTATRRRCRRT
jgi:hypothetical protein